MKRGSWELWDWQHIPSTYNPEQTYLSRLTLIRTPWGGAQLHWIKEKDHDRDPHSHPRVFWRIILRGGYVEMLYPRPHEVAVRDVVTIDSRIRAPGNVSLMRLHMAHRIVFVHPGTMTLCFVGPTRQEWGFYTRDGFVGWREYNRKKFGVERLSDLLKEKKPNA